MHVVQALGALMQVVLLRVALCGVLLAAAAVGVVPASGPDANPHVPQLSSARCAELPVVAPLCAEAATILLARHAELLASAVREWLHKQWRGADVMRATHGAAPPATLVARGEPSTLRLHEPEQAVYSPTSQRGPPAA